MRKHVASGRFSVEHYVDMWDAKIRGASALLSAPGDDAGVAVRLA